MLILSVLVESLTQYSDQLHLFYLAILNFYIIRVLDESTSYQRIFSAQIERINHIEFAFHPKSDPNPLNPFPKSVDSSSATNPFNQFPKSVDSHSLLHSSRSQSGTHSHCRLTWCSATSFGGRMRFHSRLRLPKLINKPSGQPLTAR